MEELNDIAEELHSHLKNVEKFTVDQFKEVLLQAIKCGDFEAQIQNISSPLESTQAGGNFVVLEHRQTITYIPFRHAAKLQEENERLKKILEEFEKQDNI